MPLIRATIEASPAYYLNPLWWSWRARAEAWRDSFIGYAYRPTCDLTTGGGYQATVYLDAPANVGAAQLPQRLADWSERVGGVRVKELRIVSGCGSPADDRAALDAGTVIGGITGRVNDTLGGAVDFVKLLAVVAVVALIATRKGK